MKRDEMCADCGGIDFEWMNRCPKHNLEFCRGCSCPACEEDADGEFDELDSSFF